MSRQSRLSANDGDDNEMMPETVQRSPGNIFRAEENPRKPQVGDCRRACDQSLPQMGPFTLNNVGRIAQHVRKGRKEGNDVVGN